MNSITMLTGDCIEQMRALPDHSVNCCVTSPPYYGLRDYGVNGQIGLEETPEEYIHKLVVVFREVRRVLRDDGTLWVNIGDSYAGGRNGNYTKSPKQTSYGQNITNVRNKPNCLEAGRVKSKDLLGIPWMLAFALRSDGWYLRQDIIWRKPNPMPESVRDRCTKSHEYIFLLSKSPKYYFDHEAVKEDAVSGNSAKAATIKRTASKREQAIPGQKYGTHRPDRMDATYNGEKRNRRSVWTVATRPFKGAHFATFPSELIKPCIMAGCPAKVCATCGSPATESFNACSCSEFNYDDFEMVGSPTGTSAGDDPSLQFGRAGMSRPRGKDEGRRLITRFEQRAYARQLKVSPYRNRMEEQAGSVAFAHYIRTDRSGARPVPQNLIEEWIQAGWIKRIGAPVPPVITTKPGVVLDPFGGSGTTAAVSVACNRDAILCELNPEYIGLVSERVADITEKSFHIITSHDCLADTATAKMLSVQKPSGSGIS